MNPTWQDITPQPPQPEVACGDPCTDPTHDHEGRPIRAIRSVKMIPCGSLEVPYFSLAVEYADNGEPIGAVHSYEYADILAYLAVIRQHWGEPEITGSFDRRTL